jgi:hypothetical protein
MDIRTQKMMTTVVEPIVSPFVGNDTFRNSAFASVKNSTMEAQSFLNMSMT